LNAETQSGESGKPASGTRREFTRKFLTGLVAILPIGLTLFICWFLVVKIGSILGRLFQYIPIIRNIPEIVISMIGFIAAILVIYLVGVLTSSMMGKWMIRLGEALFTRLPLVRSVYTPSRQLVDTLFVDRSAFRRVVLVEFPQKGSYMIGFVTSDDLWTIGPAGMKALSVFAPHTPNPTSGFTLLISEDKVIETNLPVEWAMKMILSGGLVAPESRNLYATSGENKKSGSNRS
jgi:uncharacterized membrane protein